MSSITLAGIGHDMKQRMSDCSLMDEYSETQFKRHILPLITEKSILFFEGAADGLLSEGESGYDQKLRGLCPPLWATNLRPKIGLFDPRSKLELKKKKQMVEDIKEIARYAQRYMKLNSPPLTCLGDLVSALREGSFSCECSTHPSDAIVRVANRVTALNEAFAREYSEALSKTAPHHDQCFLVAGLYHCLDIHIERGWEHKPLFNWRTLPLSTLVPSYASSRLFPKALRGW